MATFDKPAGRLSRGSLDDAEYEDLRAELASLSEEARGVSASMSDELRDSQQLADALGVPPGRGRSSGNAGCRADRQRLNRIIAELDGHRRQAELMATRADMLMDSPPTSGCGSSRKRCCSVARCRSTLATWTSLPAQVEFLRDRISRAFSTVIG